MGDLDSAAESRGTLPQQLHTSQPRRQLQQLYDLVPAGARGVGCLCLLGRRVLAALPADRGSQLPGGVSAHPGRGMTDLPRPRGPHGEDLTSPASPRALWTEMGRRWPVLADLIPPLVLTGFLLAVTTAQAHFAGGAHKIGVGGYLLLVGAALALAPATPGICRFPRMHGRLPSHRRSTWADPARPISWTRCFPGRDEIGTNLDHVGRGWCRRSVSGPRSGRRMVLAGGCLRGCLVVPRRGGRRRPGRTAALSQGISGPSRMDAAQPRRGSPAAHRRRTAADRARDARRD